MWSGKTKVWIDYPNGSVQCVKVANLKIEGIREAEFTIENPFGIPIKIPNVATTLTADVIEIYELGESPYKMASLHEIYNNNAQQLWKFISS